MPSFTPLRPANAVTGVTDSVMKTGRNCRRVIIFVMRMTWFNTDTVVSFYSRNLENRVTSSLAQ